MNDITVIDYSDKSILLCGIGTKDKKDILKKYKCRWNPRLSGWICSKKNEQELLETLGVVKTPGSIEILPGYLVKGDFSIIDKKELQTLGAIEVSVNNYFATELDISEIKDKFDLK